jgi:uncharacterized membrane protein
MKRKSRCGAANFAVTKTSLRLTPKKNRKLILSITLLSLLLKLKTRKKRKRSRLEEAKLRTFRKISLSYIALMSPEV